MNKLGKLLRTEDILLALDVADKEALFDHVGEHLEATQGLSKEWIVIGLGNRERIGSTGLGQGIAIPHARLKGLDHIQVLYARLKTPIPFDAPDGLPVSDVLVLLVPKQATEEHLLILAEATQLFSTVKFREALHLSHDPAEIKALFSARYR